MTRESYDAEQAHRLQQVDKTHLHTKALHDIAVEAVKYHDKYLSALERLTNCIRDNSDCMEGMRKRFENNGQGITPTDSITTALAGAFNNFKTSVQVKAMRDTLCKLADVSTIAKRNAKVSRSKIEAYGAAAKKNAKRINEDLPQKIAQANGKKKDKILQEQRAAEEQMASLNTAVEESMHALCTWWAEQLAAETEDLHKACRNLGSYLARCFEEGRQPIAPPPSTLPQHAMYPRAESAEMDGATRTVPRGDTSCYIGVSDYLRVPAPQLPPTEAQGRHVSPDHASAQASPPTLYVPVCRAAICQPAAPPSESSASSQPRRSPKT